MVINYYMQYYAIPHMTATFRNKTLISDGYDFFDLALNGFHFFIWQISKTLK